MDTIKIGHERPINRQAALVLSRAPWWAFAPEPARKYVAERVERLTVDQMVTCTNGPTLSEIPDRRGTVIEWPKSGEQGVVIGLADVREKIEFRSPSGNRKPSWWLGKWDPHYKNVRRQCIHTWWVLVDDEIRPVVWKEPSARGWIVAREPKHLAQWRANWNRINTTWGRETYKDMPQRQSR